MALGELFDVYSWRARLQPALLTLFPALVSVAVLLPVFYQTATGLLGVATACGVTIWFAHFAREQGRETEKRLNAEWGGKPTTIWLRHRDNHLDAHTKARYHAFLAEHVRSWEAPTLELEQCDPAAVDAQYDGATRWLLEHTRDRSKFPLVFKENVSYGFRRNLRGLRPTGISIALASFLANVLAVWNGWSIGAEISEANVGTLVVSLLATAAWLWLVRDKAVRDAADAYARALLSACDVNEKSSAN